MNRIKITLTDKEKEELTQEAGAAGMPTASYIRDVLVNRHTASGDISFPFNKDDLKKDGVNLYMCIPRSMNEALRKDARAHSMSKSDYIVWLISRKGTPVDLVIDLPGRRMYTQKIDDLLNEVSAACEIVTKSGSVDQSELQHLIAGLRAAAKEFLRESVRQDRNFTAELMQIEENIIGIQEGEKR